MYGTAPKADFANSGPSGAGRNCTQALLILRAGNVLITSRGYPRKQGSGADSPCQGEMARRARGGRVGDYEHEVLIRSRSIIAPSSAPFGGTYPYPLCRFATSSLPLLAYGHFPLTGGICPLTRGVGPPGGRLTGGHMGPSVRVERTDAIMCVEAGHWPARKRAADSRPYSGKRTGRAGPGPEKKSGAPVKNTGAPGQKQVKHTPPCCRFRPSGR